MNQRFSQHVWWLDRVPRDAEGGGLDPVAARRDKPRRPPRWCLRDGRPFGRLERKAKRIVPATSPSSESSASTRGRPVHGGRCAEINQNPVFSLPVRSRVNVRGRRSAPAGGEVARRHETLHLRNICSEDCRHCDVAVVEFLLSQGKSSRGAGEDELPAEKYR